VGDLINNLRGDAQGRVRVSFDDELCALIPSAERPYTILGKSIVIHRDTDDLGLQGSVILPPYLVGRARPVAGVRDESRKYASAEKRHESTRTGNAGTRIACGNIALRC
jgi:Cu/Zn superoxide dismutase